MLDILANLSASTLSLAGAIAIFSGLVHGYTGFGGALVMVPLVTLLFGPVEAVALMTIAVFLGSSYLIKSALRKADWHELWPVIIAGIIGMPLGAALLLAIDPGLSKKLIGVVVLMFAAVMMTGWRYRGPRNRYTGTFVGGLSGWLGGFVGYSGPPLVLYFLGAPARVEVQRANIVIAIAITVPALVISLAVGGAISGTTLTRSLVTATLYVTGAWLGERVFDWVPKTWFQRGAIAVLVAAGLSVLIF